MGSKSLTISCFPKLSDAQGEPKKAEGIQGSADNSTVQAIQVTNAVSLQNLFWKMRSFSSIRSEDKSISLACLVLRLKRS